jgi:hypothetical protein
MAFCVARLFGQPHFSLLGPGSYPCGQQCLAQVPLEFRQAVCLAFPDHNPLPAELLKLAGIFGIPPTISFQFRRPVRAIGFGNVALAAALVPVPEAPMYQHNDTPLRKHDVWLAREVFPAQPEPEAHPVQNTADANLGAGVPRYDAAHNLGPPLFTVDVGHGSPCAHQSRRRGCSLRGIVVMPVGFFQGQLDVMACNEKGCVMWRCGGHLRKRWGGRRCPERRLACLRTVPQQGAPPPEEEK